MIRSIDFDFLSTRFKINSILNRVDFLAALILAIIFVWKIINLFFYFLILTLFGDKKAT